MFCLCVGRHGLINSTAWSSLPAIETLAGAQCGFTPGKSTVTALLLTFHDIFQLLESGADVSLVFFDLRKAFDTVPHLPLLQ